MIAVSASTTRGGIDFQTMKNEYTLKMPSVNSSAITNETGIPAASRIAGRMMSNVIGTGTNNPTAATTPTPATRAIRDPVGRISANESQGRNVIKTAPRKPARNIRGTVSRVTVQRLLR